jgi:hypothetical protein
MDGLISQRVLEEFYDKANEIVGLGQKTLGADCHIGESTDTSFSVTGEPYVEFSFSFDNDLSKETWFVVETVFLKWIESYKYFVTYSTPPIIENPMVIYWRIKPLLEDYGDSMGVYARLLISSLKPRHTIGIERTADHKGE